MNWLVVTQPTVNEPGVVVEVRTWVVQAETDRGVITAMREQQSGQMVRGIVPLQTPPRMPEE